MLSKEGRGGKRGFSEEEGTWYRCNRCIIVIIIQLTNKNSGEGKQLGRRGIIVDHRFSCALEMR